MSNCASHTLTGAEFAASIPHPGTLQLPIVFANKFTNVADTTSNDSHKVQPCSEYSVDHCQEA